MCSNECSLQLNNQSTCHALNMIFSANEHQEIADEVENQRVPEGICSMLLVEEVHVYRCLCCTEVAVEQGRR